MKILITGATGFIGFNLAKRLVELGYDIACTGRRLNKLDLLSGDSKKIPHRFGG